ncbi:F-box/kelch-repeat protein-like protein [Tanacetum coccineum]
MLHTECVMSITALDFPMGKIVGSCNGLLCLLDNLTGISIWNPSLRRILILPYHPSLRSFYVPVGFGFDPITNDYKIVAILHKQHVKRALVCSMKTSTWCEIAFPTTPFGNMYPRACLVNGVLHWVASCLSDDGIEARQYVITFNLSTNVFGKISLPESSCKRRHLTVISGSLAVIANEYYSHTVHVRKEYNNAAYWSLVFQLRDFPKVVENVSQVTINGDLLLYVEKEDYKAYNLKTGVCSIVAKFNAIRRKP